MPIFGLVWVASWFGSFSSMTEKVLEAPRYLSHVFFSQQSSTLYNPSSKFEFSPQRVTSSSVEKLSSRFNLINDRIQPTSTTVWLGAIETLLFNPTTQPMSYSVALSHPTNYPIALSKTTASQHPKNPLNYLLGVVQSFLWTVPPGIAATDFTNPAPSVVVTHANDKLANQVDLTGYWRCAAWQENSPSRSASGGLQIWVKGCLVAEVANQLSADKVAESLTQLLENPDFDGSQLTPTLEQNVPIVKLGDRVVFRFDRELAAQFDRPAELVAIDWLNNLRIALGQEPISMADAQVKMHGLQNTGSSIGGLASWYGPYFHGRQTATGEIFDQNELTAAHPSLPFGTFLKVTNLLNGKSVVVRVNDRGPYFDDRVLDLSNRAAHCIGSENKGVVPIEAEIMLPMTVQEIARL